MHAEWRGFERQTDGGETSTSAGYDDFWMEDGLIRQEREGIVVTNLPGLVAAARR